MSVWLKQMLQYISLQKSPIRSSNIIYHHSLQAVASFMLALQLFDLGL